MMTIHQFVYWANILLFLLYFYLIGNYIYIRYFSEFSAIQKHANKHYSDLFSKEDSLEQFILGLMFFHAIGYGVATEKIPVALIIFQFIAACCMMMVNGTAPIIEKIKRERAEAALSGGTHQTAENSGFAGSSQLVFPSIDHRRRHRSPEPRALAPPLRARRRWPTRSFTNRRGQRRPRGRIGADTDAPIRHLRATPIAAAPAAPLNRPPLRSAI